MDLRPCYVKNEKALFHRWVEHQYPVAAELQIGGCPAGQISYTTGLVELEDGKVFEAEPKDIRFCDKRMTEYCFWECPNCGNEEYRHE